jgi:hypothetical protein
MSRRETRGGLPLLHLEARQFSLRFSDKTPVFMPYSKDAGNHQGISLLEPALLVISAGWRTFGDGMKP